jgi:hypothetical protein
MENSRIDAIGLLLAAVAAIIALSAAQMNFGYLSSLAGFTLLLVLFAFDRQGYRSGFQSLAFAAVCGVCLILAGGYLFHLVSSPAGPQPDHAAFEEWLGIAWLIATALFWGIDRARMGGREQLGLGAIAAPVARTTGPSFITQPAPSFIAQSSPPPAYAPPPPPQPPPEPVFEQPAPAAPVYAPPLPPPVEPVQPLATPPAAHQIPPGKEVMIYINLMGEAMNVLRTVRAEHLGRDFYLIADEMPANEDWEFKPGQIVRCKKKNLSSGKGLVAFEEAPRAS